MAEADEAFGTRRYGLNDVRLSIEADRPGLAGFLDFVLAPFGLPAAKGTDFAVTLESRAALPTPPAGRTQWEGKLPEGLDSLLVRAGDLRVLHVPPHYQAASERGSRRASVIVGPEGARWLSGSLAFWLLDELLIGAGRHFVHAACLARPPSGDALLLFAASGTGKTTTALALARNGYALVGDDAAVLEFRDGRPWAWGLPRPLNLHRRTAALLPWLEPALKPWGEAAEQRVPLAALAGCVECAAPAARPLAGVVLLRPPGDGEHSARPLAKADALVEAATDNVRLAPGGLDEDGEALFDALAQLVAAVPTVSLRAGRDPASLRPALLEKPDLVPASPAGSQSVDAVSRA